MVQHLRRLLGYLPLLGLVATSASGCRRLESLKQRCVAGETAACESACAKGVAGEGGCFHAGSRHRERAALDTGSAEFRQASNYFKRSCDGGYGDGCLLAAQMIEAPYATVEGESRDAPRAISDSDIREREKRLALACQRGSAQGCKRLGDVLIGKSTDRARVAYDKACERGAEAAACKAARAREVSIAEGWRTGCTRRIADDCTRLGDLLYAVDVPRAVRLFISECQLRGVAELAGGPGGFVRYRAAEAKAGIPLPSQARAPAPGGSSGGVDVSASALVVRGQVAVVEVARQLELSRPALSSCLAATPAAGREGISTHVIIDATGDVWQATLQGAPASVVECLRSVLESIELSPPEGGPAIADLTLRTAPRDAGLSAATRRGDPLASAAAGRSPARSTPDRATGRER